MTETTDHALLAEFAHSRAEAAFATLVKRHVNLVYSAALRHTGNVHQAEEITQAVFIILAHKAGSLSAKVVLTGWLYQTARLTAANAMKQNFRRQQREQQAYMESTLNPPDSGETWKQLAPVLDEAMNTLRTADRDAVLLRYFENKPLAEVGAALGVTEDAARVRVNRALEKLRSLLAKKGVVFGAAAIAVAVTANSVQAAPMGLAATVSQIAAQGAATTTSITTLVKGTLKTMTAEKIKPMILVAVLILFSVAIATPASKSTQQVEVLEISGSIVQKIYFSKENIIQSQTNSFVVSIWGNHARIEAGPMDNDKITGFEYGMLGKDSYLLTRYVTNLLATEVYQMDGTQPAKLKTPVRPENDATLTINDGVVPEYAFGFISPVWLAYCFHLERTNALTARTQYPPIFPMGSPFRSDDGLADISYTLNTNPPYMVQSLMECGDPHQLKPLRSYTDGIFTNAEYRALAWTNFSGFTVVQQFQVTNFVIGSRLGVIVRRTVVYEGTATNIALRLKPVPAFSIPDRTYVVERRSAMATPLSNFGYTTKNGHLLDRTELLNDADFKDQQTER